MAELREFMFERVYLDKKVKKRLKRLSLFLNRYIIIILKI